jgi:hypothetical protein
MAAVAAVFVISAVVGVSATRYSVTVKRVEKDLYREAGSKLIIETRYCYEYSYGEDAILNWEGNYGNNWLLFINSGQKCDVVALR